LLIVRRLPGEQIQSPHLHDFQAPGAKVPGALEAPRIVGAYPVAEAVDVALERKIEWSSEARERLVGDVKPVLQGGVVACYPVQGTLGIDIELLDDDGDEVVLVSAGLLLVVRDLVLYCLSVT